MLVAGQCSEYVCLLQILVGSEVYSRHLRLSADDGEGEVNVPFRLGQRLIVLGQQFLLVSTYSEFSIFGS